MSKVTIHMVASIDGYIAKPDGDVSWMQTTDTYAKGVQLTEEAMADFVKTIDCYVMGSRTYEHAMELGWPYGNTPVYVLTQRALTRYQDTVSLYAGDPETLINEQLRPSHKNIWMVGGAALTRTLIRAQLADEIVITIMPVLLGKGTPFFDAIGVEQRLHLKDVTAYRNGMVELTYQLLKA